MSIIGFISKESPVVGVGKARERLGSSRVSMKNDKNSQENRGGGAGGTWPGQQSSGHGCPSRRSRCSSGLGVSSASFFVLDLPVRGEVFLVGGVVSDFSGRDSDRLRLVLWKDASKTPPSCKEGVWSLPNSIQRISPSY